MFSGATPLEPMGNIMNYGIVFDKNWFLKWQKNLLWFANTYYGRDVLGINGNRSSVGKERIIAIAPNAIVWQEDKLIKAEFRTHDKFSKRLFYEYKYIWQAIHNWDMRFANNFAPSLNLGFDTLGPIFPAAGAASPVDGYVGRSGVNEAIGTLRAGAGTYSNNTDTTEGGAILVGAVTSNQFSELRRSIFCFDTSSLPSGISLLSVILSFNSNTVSTGLGSTSLEVVSAAPASTSGLANSDYSNLGSTSFATVPSASWPAANSYYDFTLDGNGIANVNKTGITKFGIRLGWDFNNNFTGVWANGVQSRFDLFYADQAGTTKDPKLVVTYGKGGSSLLQFINS